MTVTKTGRPQPPGLSQNIIRIRTQQLQAQQLQSEYQQAFKAWPWQPPRKSIKPASKTNKTAVLHGSNAEYMRTTNQRTFVPHNAQRRTKSLGPKTEYQKDATKMVTDTTYDVDFTRKEADRRLPYKPEEKTPQSKGRPFDNVTMYEATYVKWTPDERVVSKTEVKIPKDNLNVLRVRFEGKTTVQNDFKPHENVPPAKSMRPAEQSHRATSPFDEQTTHQTDFAPKPHQPPRECFKPTEEYKRPASETGTSSSTGVVKRYDYLTIMKRDFPEHTGHKPESSYKPKQGYRPTGTKFHDKTTQNMAYKAWPIPPKEKHPWAQRPAYNPNKAKLRLFTSYQDDYIDPSSIIALDKCRPAPCRYDNNLGAAGESAPFDDRTEYRSTFVAWEGTKRSGSYKPVQEYAPPKTQFKGESTFNSHFKGERAPPAKSCRPTQRPHSSTGASMHMESTYRSNFRRPVSCPVLEVLSSSDDLLSDHEPEAAEKPGSRPSSAE